MSKKIIAGIVALVAVFAFVVTVSAQTSLTSDLTVGSTGAEVVTLQSFLESKGFLVMPAGVAKGYFGSLTKSALARYQSSKGITPAVGYFGPITRAAVNAEGGVSTTPGCPAGAMYNTLTGAPCSTTPVTPGCPAGAAYNYMTGQPCSSSTPSTSSTEGTLDVRQAGSPANNANIQTSVDVPVYGLTLKATIADVTVDRLDLEVRVSSTANGTETPSNLINTIKLWDGSTVLKTWNVTSSDFIKDVNNSSQYYVRLSGLNFVVPKDATKSLVLSFSTNSGIDTTRTVYIAGYGSNSLRAVSGNNITSYYNISGITRSHSFLKPGAGTLTVSSDSNAAVSNNNKVSTTNGVTGVTVGSFNVKAETGDVNVTDVTVPVVVGGGATNPSTVFLYSGSTLLDSRSGPTTQGGGSVTFSNLNIPVSKDVTKTLTVKVDMPSTTATGTSISISSSTTNSLAVTYTKPNGNTASAYVTGVDSDAQYFFPVAAQITLVSATATAGGTTQTGSTTAPSAVFVFKIKPVGGSIVAPTAASTTVKFSTSTLSTATTLGVATNLTIEGNPTILAEDAEYTVTVSANITPFTNTTVAAGNSIVTFYITGIQWAPSVGLVTVSQTWGLDNYKTNPITVTK